MSMEIFVLSARRVSSIQQWQRSIDLMGISLTLSTKRSFAALRGTLPVNLGPSALYFECDHWDVDDLRRTYGNFRFEKQWKYALAMRWGGDVDSDYPPISPLLVMRSLSKASSSIVKAKPSFRPNEQSTLPTISRQESRRSHTLFVWF